MGKPNDLAQRKAIVRIKQLMRTNVRTKHESDELRTLANMLHVRSFNGERIPE